MKKLLEKKKVFYGITILFFALLISLLLYKIPYGFVSTDEAFFLTIPHRLVLGDSLIVNEWHPAQFSGLLLYPFFELFLMINGSFDGIIIFVRFLYVLMTFGVSVFIFARLRKYGAIRFVCVAVFMLYSRANIMSINYNTMGINCFLVFSFLYFLPCFKNRKLEVALSGVFYAIGVLCVPTMAVVYFLVSLYIAVKKIIGKQNKYFVDWLYLTIGISISASIVLIFLLSRASIGSLLSNFPMMFKSDPTHDMSLLVMGKKTLYFMYQALTVNLLSTISIGLFAIMFSVFLLDKKRNLRKEIYFILSLLFTGGILISYSSIAYTDYLMFSFTPIGMVSYLLIYNKEKSLFSIYLFGLIFAVFINLSSDTIFFAVSSATTISSIVSIILCLTLIREIKPENHKRNVVILFSLVICIQIGLEVRNKFTGIYGDVPKKSLNIQICGGPAKGLITTYDKNQEYIGLLKDIKEIMNSRVLIFTDKAWLYLALDSSNHYSTYSTWLPTWEPAYKELLFDFYKMENNELPNVIYIPKTSIYKYFDMNTDVKKYNYSVALTEFGYLIEKKVE